MSERPDAIDRVLLDAGWERDSRTGQYRTKALSEHLPPGEWMPLAAARELAFGPPASDPPDPPVRSTVVDLLTEIRESLERIERLLGGDHGARG